ncbi:MAG: hypothetical protein ABJF23_03480 [Bryobacteraceae bacterium]
MKKIAMTLLATAVAVPMMFAADAPKADPTAPVTKTAKKHKKAKKTATSVVSTHAAPVK